MGNSSSSSVVLTVAAVAGTAVLAWGAWRSSAFVDSDDPKESASTIGLLVRQKSSLDDDDNVDDVADDQILPDPRSDEIVEENVDGNSLMASHEPLQKDAGAASLAWGAWSYGSSWSSASVDSNGPKESASTIGLQVRQEWSLDDDDNVDDQILPDPRSDEIVEENVDGDSLMASREPLQVDAGIIKIMTYNIWSIEHIKINERMKAIGKLIQKHAPDIILLQEVTPMIYEIFQNSDWWGLYECSHKKSKRKYFCMLLSKLPMKRSYYKPFENTTTGKGLYIAKMKTRANKKLVVATCHLKRPTSPETNSTVRQSQANEALSSLQFAPNVILGGDMNWDESFDGPFPLPGKWDDAWSILRPEEDGWTYDTESNKMLCHRRRALQKRLDRFICNLKDFEMVSIYMIGKEAIPKVTYRSKGKRLPVLPSDHYGLVLVIMPKQ